ncbi:ankyrin repeat domain-containing protein [Pseudomonas sediminis]|uniref:Uncharacterized protein n=1 Tax=Pseudomonas sediminis TaxID=1691904 RepID=A0A2G5FNR5_9PSED|nr:ankyrin repeat domain-containing protein [Pseudomonas sediminis]PIA69629.1 hypothetical protein CDO35_08155 [Pseudomonas sediminis]
MELSPITNRPESANTPDEDGYYPLHHAAMDECAKNEDVKALLVAGAELEARTRHGRTALHLACLSGNHHIVKFLISVGANIAAIDEDGNTPIHMAVEGSNSSIKLLLDAGAQIDPINNERKTPLIFACEIGKVGAIKNLCDSGANTKIDQYSEKTLIRLAIDSFKSIFPSNAQQMINSLIKAGAEVGRKDPLTGKTELHIIAELTHDKWDGEKHLNTLKLLINNSGNPWERDKDGKSPISIIKNQDIESLKPALKKHIKGREISIATSIETIAELRAFYFNQSKLGKNELYELLRDGTPAKQYFTETLSLPSALIES